MPASPGSPAASREPVVDSNDDMLSSASASDRGEGPSATRLSLVPPTKRKRLTSESRRSKAIVQSQRKREDMERDGALLALRSYWTTFMDRGLGKHGEEGQLELAEWENSSSISAEVVDRYPKGPRAHLALKFFQREFNRESLKPFTTTSFRHRLALGASKKVYGTLQDVRWLQYGRGNHPWTEEEATYIHQYPRKHYVGQPEVTTGPSDAGTEDFVFHDRPDPGQAVPKHPSEFGSGGLYAACFLAAVWMRTEDKLNGYDRETMPDDMMQGDWARAIRRVFRVCWPIRELRLGKSMSKGRRPTNSYEKMRHAQTVDELVGYLIRFVWRQGLQSQQGSWKDRNLQHAWQLVTEHCEVNPGWLTEAFADLRSWAYEAKKGHEPVNDDIGELDVTELPLVDRIYEAASDAEEGDSDEEVSSDSELSEAAASPEAEQLPSAVSAGSSTSSASPGEAHEPSSDAGNMEDLAATACIVLSSDEEARNSTANAARSTSATAANPPSLSEGPSSAAGPPRAGRHANAPEDSAEEFTLPSSSRPVTNDVGESANQGDQPIAIDLVSSSDEEGPDGPGPIPQTKEELVEFIKSGRYIPPYQVGTEVPHRCAYRSKADAKMGRLAEMMGNITIPLDADILSTAKFRRVRTSARVHDADGAAAEDGPGEGADEVGGRLVSEVVDRVAWYSPWHGLDKATLQKKLQFWCAWATKYPYSVPTETMEEKVGEVLRDHVYGEDGWTLEQFLGLRKTMGRWFTRDGFKHVTRLEGPEQVLELSEAQLESALWYIHHALASKTPGYDVGGILGDTMGLGKTIQGIVFALLADKLDLFGNKPALLLAQRTLLDQWLTTWVNVVDYGRKPWKVYDGDGCRPGTKQWYTGRKALPLYRDRQYPSVISSTAGAETLVLAPSTYCRNTGMLERNPRRTDSLHKPSLADREWGLVLFDEAHRLKHVNPGQGQFEPLEAKLFAHGNIGFRVLLSGTPMAPTLQHQWTINRSGGSSHMPRDARCGSDNAGWRALEYTGKDLTLAIKAASPSALEFSTLQDEAVTLVASEAPPAKKASMLESLSKESRRLTQLTVANTCGERVFKKHLLPFFSPKAECKGVGLPLGETQNFLLRRFLDFDDVGVKPIAFAVRVPMPPRFQTIYKNHLGLLKAQAATRASEQTLKVGHVGEMELRHISTHGSLAGQLYEADESLGEPEANRGDLRKARAEVAALEAEMRQSAWPVTYRPSGVRKGSQQDIAYNRLADLRGKIAQWETAEYLRELAPDLGNRVAQQCLLADMASPTASVVVALLRNIFASARGDDVPPELRNFMPPARRQQIKILIYCQSYVGVAFASQTLRTNGYESMHSVNAGMQRNAIIETFVESKDCHILILTAKDTTGIELQRASCLIFWDIPGNEAVQLQAIGRIARRGQTVDPWIYLAEVEGSYCDHAQILQRLKKAVTTAIDEGPGGDCPTIERRNLFAPALLEYLRSAKGRNEIPANIRASFEQAQLDAWAAEAYGSWMKEKGNQAEAQLARCDESMKSAKDSLATSQEQRLNTIERHREAVLAVQDAIEEGEEDKQVKTLKGRATRLTTAIKNCERDIVAKKNRIREVRSDIEQWTLVKENLEPSKERAVMAKPWWYANI